MHQLLRGESRQGPVLDLGCSIGAWAWFFAEEGYPRPIGIDLSERHLRAARIAGLGPLCADGCTLPLASGTVETILCVDMLVHVLAVERQERVLAEIARVLRPGGVAVFSVPSVVGYRKGHQRLVMADSVYMTLRDAEHLLHCAPLCLEAVQAIQWVESVWPLWRWVPPVLRYRLGMPLLDRLGQRWALSNARLLFLKGRKA